jgi:phosphopantetheinyl transferase
VIDKPAVNCVASEQPGGWSLVRGSWDPSLRQMMMRRYLTESERVEYEAMVPRAAGPWLLGRVAAKDAVRRWLWSHGAGPIFPAEIVVANDPSGKPVVTGPLTEPIAVSLAHSGALAVAMVRSAQPGEWAPGIDIESIEQRAASLEAVALTVGERELLDAIATAQERSRWIVRFWAAKEAVSKARGTGLLGRPQDFVVVEAQADGTLRVAHQDEVFRVASTIVEGDLGVVAWVTGHPVRGHSAPGHAVPRGSPAPGDLELMRNNDVR